MAEEQKPAGEQTQEAEPKQEEGTLTRAERRKKKKEEKREAVKAKRLARNAHARLFKVNKKGQHMCGFMNFLRILFYPIHYICYPFRLHGAKKVGQGACIFFGNHYTIFDVFYPAHTTWEGIHYLTKQSVLEAPVLNWWGMLIGAIGAKRDGSDVRTLMESLKVLKAGDKLSLFPEGTRNKSDGDEFLPFHGGAALLAIKTKSPIVPFVICNKPRPFHMTHVVFGEPVYLTEYYDRKLTSADYDEADEKLRNLLYDLRAEFRASREKGKK